MQVVSAERLRQLVSMREAIDAVREAYVAVANGEFAAIPRIGAPSHSLFAMMAERTARDGAPRFGQSVKLVSYNEVNPAAGHPVVQGVVVWFDGETGAPSFCIDGAAVTSLRTGAASGVATDLFAAKDASTLAVIGAGAIATDQIRAVLAVRPIRSIRVIARDARKARSFAGRIAGEFPGIDVRATLTVREAVAGAGVICTVTTARAPLVGLYELANDVHVNAIGSFSPAMCEIAANVFGAARRICVDDRSALEDTGDVAGAIAAGMLGPSDVALIGEALQGNESEPKGGVTIFKSIGIAPQDWAIAARVAAMLQAPTVPA